jgi:hypothetical protein
MKAVCYLQLVPLYRRGSGVLRGLAVKQLTAKHPGQPIAGGRLIRVEFDLPDNAFDVTRVSVVVPLTNSTPRVEATIPA